MSNIKIMTFNLITQSATTLTASDEDSFYPASNLKDPRTTKTYRSTTGTSSANIILDFKTIEPVDYIMVAEDATNGFGWTSMTVEANATPSFSSPAFTTTVTYDAAHGVGIKSITEQNYRYWRIVLGSTGNYVELSKIFIGKAITAGKSINFDWKYNKNDTSKSKKNRYSQLFIDELPDQNRITASFKYLTTTEFEELYDAFDQVGVNTPFWIDLDPAESIITDKERFAGYYYLRKKPQVSNPFYRYYNFSMTLEQAI